MLKSQVFQYYTEKLWEKIKSTYTTKADMNNKLLGKSDTSHNHDGSYYTKSEINNKLSNLPTITYGTTDLTSGVSELDTGTLYVVYEK